MVCGTIGQLAARAQDPQSVQLLERGVRRGPFGEVATHDETGAPDPGAAMDVHAPPNRAGSESATEAPASVQSRSAPQYRVLRSVDSEYAWATVRGNPAFGVRQRWVYATVASFNLVELRLWALHTTSGKLKCHHGQSTHDNDPSSSRGGRTVRLPFARNEITGTLPA